MTKYISELDQHKQHCAHPICLHRIWMRNVCVWLVLVGLWLILDRASKHYVDSLFTQGSVIVPDVASVGLLKFNLVHNTGIAWGAFSNSVSVISVVTLLLCIAIAAFSLFWARRAMLAEILALALVFAGGVGNLYDRVAYGYVVDFITPLFINFPTFNIADIGVTFGIAFLACVWIMQSLREEESQGFWQIKSVCNTAQQDAKTQALRPASCLDDKHESQGVRASTQVPLLSEDEFVADRAEILCSDNLLKKE